MEKYFINQQNNTDIIIGGVKKLVEASNEQIVVGVLGAVVIVIGEKLKIERFDENEIILKGKIISVTTEHGGKRSKGAENV